MWDVMITWGLIWVFSDCYVILYKCQSIVSVSIFMLCLRVQYYVQLCVLQMTSLSSSVMDVI